MEPSGPAVGRHPIITRRQMGLDHHTTAADRKGKKTKKKVTKTFWVGVIKLSGANINMLCKGLDGAGCGHYGVQDGPLQSCCCCCSPLYI
jgi:hypothetical protein